MKLIGIVTGLLFAAIAAPQETLVMPPQAVALAEAHHCHLVDDYNSSPEALTNLPYDMRFGKDAFARMVTTWCIDETAKPGQARSYKLLVRMDDHSNPLHACPDEIRNLRQIGGLSFRETGASPAYFRFLDTGKVAGQLNSVESVNFVILSTHKGREELFACIDGRWARAAPGMSEEEPRIR